jgi:replicative DNA helicase
MLSIDAEQSVLGALLIDGTALDRVAGSMRPEHFTRTDHRVIMQAMLDCAEVGEPIDVVTVSERLRRNEGPDGATLSYLASLAANTPSAANIAHWARMVVERADRRGLLGALSEAHELARSSVMPFRDVLDAVQAKVMALTEHTSGEPIRLADAAPAWRAELSRRASGESAALATRLTDLDQKLDGGLRPGELVVVAGRSSMGKSAFAFQIAEHAARTGHPALVMSLEMSRQDLLDRAVAGETRIPLEQLRSGESAGHPYVEAALEAIGRWPLFIDDTPAMSVHQIRAKARTVKRRHGLELLVVDYLQLMSGDGETRNLEIAGITGGLKALAKELAVPVLAVSQLNRGADNRADRRPQLSDLRDSGAIEQDADIAMFVHREAYYRPSDTAWAGKGEVIVRKNRQGATGDVRLLWRGELTRFDNFAGEWPSERENMPARRRGFGDD